jgi:hypothetical protein
MGVDDAENEEEVDCPADRRGDRLLQVPSK